MNENPESVSFERANAVAAKFDKLFGDEPWCGGVGVNKDEKFGYFVELRIHSELLPLKPEQVPYFSFTLEEEGVQVRLVLVEMAVAHDTE